MTTDTLIPNHTPMQVTIHPLPQNGGGNQTAFLSGANNTPTFKDFLDTINPLQHIPIVSNIYQALTGDTPSPASKIAGDTLFGGPIGMIASIFDSVVTTQTGTGVAGNIMAAIEGNSVPALAGADKNKANPPMNAHIATAYNAYVSTQNLTA